MDCWRFRRFLFWSCLLASRVVWWIFFFKGWLEAALPEPPSGGDPVLAVVVRFLFVPLLADLVLFQPKGPCLIHVWYMPGLSGYFDPPSQFCRFLSRALELTARIERTFLIIQKVGLRLPYWFSFCVPHRTVLLTRSNCLKFVLVAT